MNVKLISIKHLL